MFARADRTFLNDANRNRFSHQPPPFCNEPLSPGPTAYQARTGGWKVGRTTRRYLFAKGVRKQINAEEIVKDTPGPGSYSTDLPGPQALASPSNTDRKKREYDRLAEAGVAGSPEGGGVQHSHMFTVSRVPRLFNMITGVNEPHSLREYVRQRSKCPGPADYELPSLWHGAATARAGSHRSGRGPRAVLPRTGRREDENVDGSRLDPRAPGPDFYDPVRIPRPPQRGTIDKSPRGVEQLPTTEAPGPGAYSPVESAAGKLKVQIPQASRMMDRVVCGVDLKKCRKLPGPASYHPIHDDIVRQPYTV